jgi:hypothetical protein
MFAGAGSFRFAIQSSHNGLFLVFAQFLIELNGNALLFNPYYFPCNFEVSAGFGQGERQRNGLFHDQGFPSLDEKTAFA